MKLLLIICIFCCATSAFAECNWQDKWFVCEDAAKPNDYDKISSWEPQSLTTFRYWHIWQTGLVNVMEYREINCANKTTTIIQKNIKATALSSDEIQNIIDRQVNKPQFYPPDSSSDKQCISYIEKISKEVEQYKLEHPEKFATTKTSSSKINKK